MTEKAIIFLHAVVRERVESWIKAGIVAGLDIDLKILKRDGARLSDLSSIVEWATDAGAREFCISTWGEDAAEFYDNGIELHEMVPNAAISVPLTDEGVVVASRLNESDVPVRLVGGNGQYQALIASILNVRYLTPSFNSTVSDAAEFGSMVRCLPAVNDVPRVMARGMIHPEHFSDLVQAGVRAFSMHPDYLEKAMVAIGGGGDVEYYRWLIGEGYV